MRRFTRRESDEYDRYERDNFRYEGNNFDKLYDAEEYSLDTDRDYPPTRRDRGNVYDRDNDRGVSGSRSRYSPRMREDEPERDDIYEGRMRRYVPPERIGEREAVRNHPPSQPDREEHIGTNNVVVSYPRTYTDVQRLIDSLRSKQAAIVDIAKIDPRDAQRILDFLSGAIYALGGSQQRIATSIYLLTPGGISIKIPYELKEKLERGKK